MSKLATWFWNKGIVAVLVFRFRFFVLTLAIYVAASLSVTLASEVGYSGMQVQGMKAVTANALGLKLKGGVLVRDVELGGSANMAGVERGDILLQLNKTKIDTLGRLIEEISITSPGQTVKLIVRRRGGIKQLRLRLGKKPPAREVLTESVIGFSEIGITLAAITPKMRGHFKVPWNLTGVLVTLIDQKVQNKMLLDSGNVIIQVNQTPVWDPMQVRLAYDAAKVSGLDKMLILVGRPNGYEFMMLPVK